MSCRVETATNKAGCCLDILHLLHRAHTVALFVNKVPNSWQRRRHYSDDAVANPWAQMVWKAIYLKETNKDLQHDHLHFGHSPFLCNRCKSLAQRAAASFATSKSTANVLLMV